MPDELRKDPGIVEIPFDEPAGLAEQAMKPFQAGPPHPLRGARFFIGQKIDRSPHAQRRGGFDLVAVGLNPDFLLGRPQPHYDHIGRCGGDSLDSSTGVYIKRFQYETAAAKEQCAIV